MMGYTAGILTHVAMKYGRSKMAEKSQKDGFFLILAMDYQLLVEVAKIL